MGIYQHGTTTKGRHPKVGDILLIEDPTGIVFFAECHEVGDGYCVVNWGDSERINYIDRDDALIYGGLRELRGLVGKSFNAAPEAIAASKSCPLKSSINGAPGL